MRSLGNPTDKAWLTGWDAGLVGFLPSVNPYKRGPQRRAWERGRAAGARSDMVDVQIMKLRQSRRDAHSLSQ